MKRNGIRRPLLFVLITATCACSFGDNAAGDADNEDDGAAGGDPTPDGERAEQDEAAGPQDLPASPARPNVLLVLLDTLRPDYLEVYGAEHDTAPFLKGLAAQSVVFDNALSTSSWTAPATASVFTGLYPPGHTVVQGYRAHRGMIAKLREKGHATIEMNHMPTGIRTLPEMFKRAGYGTFGLAANINIGHAIGFSRGFDKFKRDVQAPAASIFKTVSTWREEIVNAAPFFLYLHLNDAHTPYHKRRPYYQASSDPKEDARARYRSEIRYLDSFLERIWNLPGIRENTILAVLSDHGEEFWEHGGVKHGPTLFAELNRVVMILHGPQAGLAPMRVEENVSQVDVVPTLATLIGADLDEAREGISLVPLTAGADTARDQRKRLHDRCLFAHRMLSATRDVAAWSVTCGPLKLIDWRGERRMLFDHRTDPGELHDISGERPRTADQLFERLTTFKKRMSRKEHVTATTEIALDEDLLARLEALGYVE